MGGIIDMMDPNESISGIGSVGVNSIQLSTPLKWQEQEDNIIISQILKEVMVCLSLPIVLLSIAINN